MNVLGIDIGGTKIFVGRYSPTLELEAKITVPTLADQPKEKTLENLLNAINEVKNQETQGIGIAWAGFVDTQKGLVVKAPNIPNLDGFALCQHLTKHTNLPSIIENDARAFAYGARAKVAPDCKMCLGIIIGTGVGSGLIYQGDLIYGAHGYAGEIGHITRQNKEIEEWLAGPGLKEFLKLPPDTQFSDILPHQRSTVLEKIESPLTVLSQWLSGLVLTLDPDHIIIGGGTGIHFWQHFKDEIYTAATQALVNYPNQFELSFYKDDNAGAIGAAQLAFDHRLKP